MCKSKKNFIGCISDPTTTLFSTFLLWPFREVFEFICPVRRFHVYRRFWTPEKGKLLNYFHERGNVFDPFATKVCERNTENRSDICLERYQGSPNSSLNEEQLWMSS